MSHELGQDASKTNSQIRSRSSFSKKYINSGTEESYYDSEESSSDDNTVSDNNPHLKYGQSPKFGNSKNTDGPPSILKNGNIAPNDDRLSLRQVIE